VAGRAAFGGSNFWVEAPDHIDTEVLAIQLETRGVLIEAGAPFFHGKGGPKNFFRLAYSSISREKIPAGIEEIKQAVARY